MRAYLDREFFYPIVYLLFIYISFSAIMPSKLFRLKWRSMLGGRCSIQPQRGIFLFCYNVQPILVIHTTICAIGNIRVLLVLMNRNVNWLHILN